MDLKKFVMEGNPVCRKEAREFDSWISEKVPAGRIKSAFCALFCRFFICIFLH